MTFPARVLGAVAVASALAFPGVAAAQTADDCTTEANGSAAAAPAECEVDPDVLGEVEERPDEPLNPAPNPQTIPVTAPETLTATGVDSDVLALGAGAAIALGGAALFVSRRKTTHADLDA